MSKRLNFPTKNVKLDSGSLVHWQQRVGDVVPVTCAVCGIKHDVSAYYALAPNFRGYHADCYQQLKRKGVVAAGWRKYTHDQILPKGTKAIFSNRRADNCQLVAMECRGCFKQTSKIKYVRTKTVWSYIKAIQGALSLVRWEKADDPTLWFLIFPYLKGLCFWDELCTDCITERGSLSKFTGEKIAPSGTVTYIPKEDYMPAIIV